MLRGGWLGLGPRQLRWGLGLFIVAVAIPTGLLIAQAYRELRWEAFHQGLPLILNRNVSGRGY